MKRNLDTSTKSYIIRTDVLKLNIVVGVPMLPKLLIRHEASASLGKTEHTFTGHSSGDTIEQCVTHETKKNNNPKPIVFRRSAQANDTARLLNESVTLSKRQFKPLIKTINKSMIPSMDKKKRL